jgi:hypothetical protein
MKLFHSFVFIFLIFQSFAQDFKYEIYLKEKKITNLHGLHSFASAQDGNKILLIGGRKDGIHARQPFNAFPKKNNNDSIFVIDIESNQIWKKSLEGLPISIIEQLQSTNMNHYQDEDTLVIVGGYAFSSSKNDHISFPYLTTIHVSVLIQHVIENNEIKNDIKQIENQIFANTGGALNKIGNYFYLVGGHRFDGRYNPMDRPTFTQTYLSGIIKFKLKNSPYLDFEISKIIFDPIHLHRRDFNLLTQLSPKKEKYLMISSGVFQLSEDLPFLYPVEINNDTHLERTEFNQYLSNYHCANAIFYEEKSGTNFSLFFGGISQYYFRDKELIYDENVPFVKTISLLKNQNGTYEEFKLSSEMPNLKGAGAEFFPLNELEKRENSIIILDKLFGDSIKIGHLFGGIQSSSISAFTDNETELTQADASLYEVYLIKSKNPHQKLKNIDSFNFTLSFNPKKKQLAISFELEQKSEIYFYITDSNGEIVDEGLLSKSKKGLNINRLTLDKSLMNQNLMLTISKDYKSFDSEKFYFDATNLHISK